MAPRPLGWRRGSRRKFARRPRPTERKCRCSMHFGLQLRDGTRRRRPPKLPRPWRRRRASRRPSVERPTIPLRRPVRMRLRSLPLNPAWSRGWPIPSTRTDRSRRSCRRVSCASARSLRCAITSSVVPSLPSATWTAERQAFSSSGLFPARVALAKFNLRNSCNLYTARIKLGYSLWTSAELRFFFNI